MIYWNRIYFILYIQYHSGYTRTLWRKITMKRATFVTLLVTVLLIATVGGAFAAVQNYRAHLSGRFEIPLIVDTKAQGQAIFQLSEDGKSLNYKLNAANITNVFMAHIHLLPASGTGNGPIVVWLYPSTPFTPSQTVPPASWIDGRFDGVLAEGASRLITLSVRWGHVSGKIGSRDRSWQYLCKHPYE